MEGASSAAVTKQDLPLGPMVSISRTMASLVQGLLGPGGQQTLMSTSTGKVMVTRDGLTILSSLHLDHPLAHLIMSSLRSCSSLYGDGSKTFILCLSQILKDIEDHLNKEGGRSTVSRMKLSVDLSKFLHSDFEHIARLVVGKVRAHSERRGEDDLSIVKNVLRSSLCTCLQKQMVSFFTDYLATFLSLENLQMGDLQIQLEHVLRNFDMYHSKVKTQPQQKSKVCQGILLEADLQNICPSHDAAADKRFALMNVNFDESEHMNGKNIVSVHLISDKVGCLLSQRRVSIQRILESLKSASVHVLLCADTVPEFVQGLCRENNIIVHCLPHDKLVFLGELTGTPILAHLNETVPTKCFFVGRVCSFVHIGKKTCTMINLTGNVFPSIPLKHLIVCAPTEGLCDQLCYSLYKALKAVAECQTCLFQEGSSVHGSEFDDSNGNRNMLASVREENCVQTQRNHSSTSSFAKSAMVITCGGMFEALLTAVISDYYTNQNCRPAEQVGALIQKMVVSVPRALHSNLCSAKHAEQHQFTEKWTRMLSLARSGQLWGLDNHGVLVNSDCIEPVGTKLAIVTNVLQLVVQLLRVEAVVSVKKPVSCISTQEHSDNEKEDEEY